MALSNYTIDKMEIEKIHRAIRDDFPILKSARLHKSFVYLDSAATTLKPQVVIDEVVHYYTEIGANIHRGVHLLSEIASDKFEESRTAIAQLIGCQSNEIIFTSGATDGLNQIATLLDLKKDDLVVAALDSHHSNILPWSRSCQLELFSYNPNGDIDLDRFERVLKQRPKVVTLTHRSNVTGIYLPVMQMAKMAKNSGALVVLDAAQSIAHRRLQVNSLFADFIVFSGHKMLGPSGIGVLYGKAEVLAKISPARIGGGSVDHVSDTGNYQLRKSPHKFEAGTPNIEGVLALKKAIEYLNCIGFKNIESIDTELKNKILNGVRERAYLDILYPDSPLDRGATTSLILKDIPTIKNIVKSLSDSYGIMCRSGRLCAHPLVNKNTSSELLRISPYIYNTPEDIDYFFHSLDELVSIYY